MSKILVTKQNHITTITINRPEHKNAIDQEAAELLMQAWLDFRDDDNQYVAILTGTAGGAAPAVASPPLCQRRGP